MSGGQTPTGAMQAAAPNLGSGLEDHVSEWGQDSSQHGPSGQGAGIVPWQVLSGDAQTDEQLR